jgi:hypothetical protein
MFSLIQQSSWLVDKTPPPLLLHWGLCLHDAPSSDFCARRNEKARAESGILNAPNLI